MGEEDGEDGGGWRRKRMGRMEEEDGEDRGGGGWGEGRERRGRTGRMMG